MKHLAAFICIGCIYCSSAYFFPMSPTNDKSHLSYLNIFNLPNIPYLSSTTRIEAKSVEKVEKSLLWETYDGILSLLMTLYKETVQTVWILVDYFPKYKTESATKYYYPFGHLPFWQSDKARADSRLYFLFVVWSLGIYLALYIYFLKKLFRYYQKNVREQYLRDVRKVLERKDKEQL